MRNVFNIINKLTKEEKRHFKLYLNRTQKSIGNKRVLDLYEGINSQSYQTDQELKQQLFTTISNNNFYQIKNRLLDDLEKSLFLLHTDSTQRLKLIYQIGIAKIYANKLLHKEAFALLKKTEKNAIKEEYYNLLLMVYETIIQVGMEYTAIDIELYLNKQIEALDKYSESLKIEQLLQRITYQQFQSNYAIKDNKLHETLESIRKQLTLQKEVIDSPKIQFSIHDCIRKVLLQKKDFKELEKHLITKFNDFTAKKLYNNKKAQAHKIIDLVWIINSLFKNFRIKESEPYIHLLYQSLLAYHKMYYERYIWTYYQCIIIQFFYTNQCQKAIHILEEIVTTKHHSGNPFYDVFLRLNLACIYYAQDDLKTGMKHLGHLLQKDNYDGLPKETQLRLSVVNIIFHFENKDFVFLAYKIAETRKTFRTLLQQESYQREKEFLKIIRKCIQKPQPFEQPIIQKITQQFIHQSPEFEPGSNESISYKLWLHAKLTKQAYYQVILQAVSEPGLD